jgi:hypothetical protein
MITRKSPSTKMTKAAFLSHVAILYRAANYADSDDERRAAWMPSAMAGAAGCGALDTMLHAMVECGALTDEELQEFHDNI